jgi:hypothetical protein
MVIRIDRFVSGNWGRLADDVLCLATMAFIFAWPQRKAILRFRRVEWKSGTNRNTRAAKISAGSNCGVG